MANTILITANWHTGALSQQTISRQYDNNRYAVRFVGYPEASDGNELDYYLLVWMSTAPGQKPGEITPIQLNSDQWYISNYFTQQVQVIKFQLCVLNEAGTYEAHSPIFSGRIGDSLEHDGTSHDIDVSTLFDAYREYLNELIIGAGAVIIDPIPTQGSTNAVQSGGVYTALHNTDTTLTQSGQAADAKVVGDKIEEVKSDLSDVQGAIGYKGIATWDTGYIQTVAVGQTASFTRTAFGTLSFIIADCVKGQHFVINGTPRDNSGTRPYMFVDKNNICKYRSNETAEMVNYEIVAPCDGKLVVNLLNAYPHTVRSGYADISTNVSNLEDIVGISTIKFIDGYYIATKSAGQTLDSLTPQSSTLTKYALIDCYAKERIVISGTPTSNSGRALYMFVDANLKVLERGKADGVAVEDMVLIAPADCKLAINCIKENPCSGSRQFMNMGKTVSENEATSADYKSLKNRPLTKLPDYFINNMAFKPLGALDKGYMVLITDDGREDGSLGVCSFTIPLAIEKHVPFTFSLMSTSDVFTNQTWIDTLLDAIENHGCSVAQHGVRRFSTYGEQELVQFFDSEKAFFDSKGIELHGAVCPAHCINKMVMAVAGGRFGVVRSGYFGGTAEDKAQYNGIDLSNFYDYYTSGANSNKYGLSCFNIAARSLDYSKSAIDYAYANNKILIALYHEYSSDLPDAGTKQKIADVIDYAKAKGMTFITLGDIEKLPFASTSTW